MKPLKKIPLIILWLSLCLSLTGCYDHKELDELGYVIAIGIDKSDNYLMRYTFQIAKPLEIIESKGGSADISEESGGGEEESGGGGGDSPPKEEIKTEVTEPPLQPDRVTREDFSAEEILSAPNNSGVQQPSQNTEQKNPQNTHSGKSQSIKTDIKDSKNKTVFNVVVEAPSIHTALNLLRSFVSKEIVLSHVKIVLFSSELAKEGLGRHAHVLIQESQFRPDVLLGVARESAEGVLRAFNPMLESNPAKYYELIATKPYSAYGITVTLHKFISNSVELSGEAILPLFSVSTFTKTSDFEKSNIKINYADDGKFTDIEYKAGEIRKTSGTNIETIGMAVFRNSAMVSEMTGNDVFMYKIITQDMGVVNMSVRDMHDPNQALSFTVQNFKKQGHKVMVSGTQPEISVNLKLAIDITGIEAPERYSGYNEVEEYIQNILKGQIEAFLKKTTESKSDIIGFGKILKRQFLTWNDWEKEDWQNIYENSQFSVTISARFARSGMIIPLQMRPNLFGGI